MSTNRAWGGLGSILAALLVACSADTSHSVAEFAASRHPLPPPGTDVVGSLAAVRARASDSLLGLARNFDVGHDEILDANPEVNPELPGGGARVLIPTQHILPPGLREGIVVNLAALRLYYYPADGHTVITHPAGIGRGSWATPEGNARVVSKDIDPVWRIPPSIRTESARLGETLPAVVPPGPDNPLGQYALRLNLPGYLIHGTNRPYGIGMRVSHGCIQLYPEDISALFPKVPVGTKVTVINRPYLIGRIAGHPYLEAHPPQEDDATQDRAELLARLHQSAQEAGVDVTNIHWEQALRIARMARGVPLPIYRGAPAPEVVLASVPLVESAATTNAWLVK